MRGHVLRACATALAGGAGKRRDPIALPLAGTGRGQVKASVIATPDLTKLAGCFGRAE